jgi:vacuolar-type H+-ATPase subunit E/Vma4
MEIIQTDDTLRKEILNDAKTKAERIVKKAEAEAVETNKNIGTQLEKIKAEYEENIIGEADAMIDLLFASVEVDAKKEIINICGSHVDDIFEEIKQNIIENKTFTYKDIMFRLIKSAGKLINAKSFIIETNNKELKILGKENLMKMEIQKKKIKEIINNDNLNGLFLYSQDKKVASHISIDKYIEDLKNKLRNRVYELIIKGKDK